MQRHHTVQKAYLKQWFKSPTENYFCIYIIPKNTYIEKGSPGWSGFFRKDFNIFKNNDPTVDYYLPEKVTERVDDLGINAIRKIDVIQKGQLSGEDRSTISFYLSLQYIRTPRHREELDDFLEKQIKYLMRKDLSSPEKVGLTKEEILRHKPTNKKEELALEHIRGMSDDEIRKQVFEHIHGEDFHLGLNKTGHSKSILKDVERLAKEVFEIQWLFFIAAEGTSFITSDNPCFTISKGKIMNGLLSKSSMTIFPLRPDLCMCIRPATRSQTEKYLRLGKREVRSINRMVISNSYQAVVARDKKHLESIVRDYDYKNHKKTRSTVIYEIGDYTMFNIE